MADSDGLHFARRIRTSPYFNRVQSLGVSGYSVYNHMLLPKSFGTSLEEAYWHLNSHVQIWDVSVQRQVEITGPDAAKLVQWITPRDLRHAVPGRCYYIPVVDESGGMLNDPVLLKLAEDRYWLSIADSDLLLYIKGLATGASFNVTAWEPDVNPLAIQGHKAMHLAADLFGPQIAGLRFFHFTHIDILGTKQLVSRSGFSSKAGIEIYLDDPHLAEPLWDLVWQAGQKYGIRPGAPNLIDRIEAGLLGYGNEMTRDNNPLELGYGRFCTLDGSIDCIGLEALQRIAETGPDRIVRGIRFDGPPCPPCHQPWRLTTDGRFAGQVTSAVWSPRFGANVGLGLVEQDDCAPGTIVQVHRPDSMHSAGIVCELPFKDEKTG